MASPAPANKDIFAQDLFKNLSRTQFTKNVIISPISVQTALAMTYLGAEGETAKELEKGLRLHSKNKEEVGQYFSKILSQKKGEAQLNIANRIFVNLSYEIVPTFNVLAKKYFDSEAETLDFRQSSNAVKIINSWIEKKTNNKINNVLQPSSINDETSAVIVNAIYFKGKWQIPFSKDMTRKSPFWINSTQSVNVDTMYGSEHLKYGEFPEINATAIEMPYKGSDISMMVILPQDPNGLADLETKLSEVNIYELSSKMRVQSLDLSLPKFRIEYSIELNDVLKTMGMQTLFEKANLPGIFKSGPTVKVSDVQHKAFIDVNEAGSEAAAATILKITPMSLEFNKKNFNADHPFAFVIKGPETVYFMGHVASFQ